MIYQIYCDGYLLDDIRTDNYIVADPKLLFEKNKVSGLTFTIYKTHPYYDKVKISRSIIEVRKNDKAIFRGVVSEYSQEFDLKMNVDVEGVLAFLSDSLYPPFEHHDSPTVLFTDILNNHNSQVQEWQQLKVGIVDIIDKNDYVSRESTSYLTSWEAIETRLLNIGGLLRVRYEDDGNYLDWLAGTAEELGTATQVIKYGENLIDLKRTNNAKGVYTAIIPIGATIENAGEETTARVTLETLPDDDTTDIVKAGKWLYSKSAVEAHGWKAAPVNETTWDDVTEDTNLLKKGTALLTDDFTLIEETQELNAYDLGLTDDEINSFDFLEYVRVESVVHGVENTYLLSKLELPYKSPQNTKITVGDTKKSLTDEQLGNKQQQDEAFKQIEDFKKDYSTNERVNEIISQQQTSYTEIIQDAKQIILTALTDYVENGTYEDFKQTVEAQLSILADSITMKFTTATEQTTALEGDTQTKFEEIYKHIKFNENGITIQAGDAEFKLRLDNDLISFYKGEIDETDLTKNRFGYWDGVDFYTGNIVVEVNERAQFGCFAAVPRSDDSLMWLKVR